MAFSELKVLQDYYDKLINVLKVQGNSLFSHFVSNKIVTLTDYDDSSEIFHSQRVKATWLVQKVSGHLAAGYSMSFHKMLLIMQEHGDVICEALSNDIEARLSELNKAPIPDKKKLDSNGIVDFSVFNNHHEAFTKLLSTLKGFFEQVDLSTIQQACLLHFTSPDGLQYSGTAKLVRKITESNQLKDLLLILAGSDHWSWFDTRLLEAMVNATDIAEAKQTFTSYDKHISTFKVDAIFHSIPVCLFSFSEYDTIEEKFDKHENELTVGDIRKYQFHLEKLSKTAHVKLRKIKTGCLEFLWLIPKQHVKQGYNSALANHLEFAENMYLKVARYPVIFSSKYASAKEISSAFQPIHCYYKMKGLIDHFLYDIYGEMILPKLHSHGLLSDDDKMIISSVPTGLQSNWLLLQCVIHFNSLAVLTFCQLVQQYQPEVFQWLMKDIPGLSVTADNILQLVSDIPEVSVPTSNHYFDPSVVYTEFLYLTDKVRELLQSCDPEVLVETCRNLMASDVHKINVFSDEYVEKLSRYTSVQSVVWELTSYSTWSDHSVLRMLAGSCEEAIKLLDEFDSRLDPMQPLKSYEVHSCLHSNMIPHESSAFTLLAVKVDEDHEQPSLQFVYNTQSLLMEKLNITQHCFQLLAVRHSPSVIYWIIPKCAVVCIKANNIMIEKREEFTEKGILELVIYEGSSSSYDISVKDSCLFTITETVVKANEQKDHPQSELEKTREPIEWFRKAAENSEAASKQLQEEFNTMKDKVEMMTTVKLVDLYDKLTSHRSELENTIQQLMPDSKLPVSGKTAVLEPARAQESLQLLESEVDNLGKLSKHLQNIQVDDAMQDEQQHKCVPVEEEPWYYHDITRADATQLLKVDGDYLVRYVEAKQCYVITTQWEGIDRHLIIQALNDEAGQRFCLVDKVSFPSISELLTHYVNSQSPVTKRNNVMLRKPICKQTFSHQQPHLILSYHNIALNEKPLSKGVLGEMYSAFLRDSGKPVCVKRCYSSVAYKKQLCLREIDLHKQLDHSNIIKLLGVCSNGDILHVVMESMAGGNFLHFLQKEVNQTPSQLLTFSLDAAQGMEYLASRNIIHRDLAARNCMIGEQYRVLKISDFRLSREAKEGLLTLTSGDRYIPIKWTAPEVLNYGQYTSASDVWSYGILLYEIFSHGLPPYPGMNNMQARNYIELGNRMEPPENTPKSLYNDVMSKCWIYEPEKRPTFSQIITTLKSIQISQ